MRPKFRAWDGAKKEMFKDTFAITESGQVIVVEQEFVTSPPDYVFVDHLTIMQSTGLKDKNGKEIFEGDIVSIDTDEFDLLFVKYEAGIYWLMDDEECVEHLSDYYKYVSIVGNIYENPELLEVEE